MFLSSCVLEALVYSVLACSTLMSQYFAFSGFSPFQLGLIMALPPLTSIYANYIYFGAAIKFSTKRVVRLFALGSLVSLWFVFLLKGFTMKFLFMTIFAFFQGAFLPLIESAMIDYSHRSALSYSKIRIWGTIGYVITAFAAGRVIRFGFVWLFVIFSVVFVMINILSKKLHQEASERQKIQLRGVDKKFIALFVVITVSVGFNLFNSIFLPVVVKERSYDLSLVGAMFSLMALSELPFLLNAEKIQRKLTGTILFLSGVFMVGTRLILVPLSWSQTTLILIQMLHGWTFIVIYYSTVHLMKENLKGQSLLSTQTVFWIALQGIGPLMGSTIGGIFVEKIGTNNTYLFFGIICLGMAAYTVHFFKRHFRRIR